MEEIVNNMPKDLFKAIIFVDGEPGRLNKKMMSLMQSDKECCLYGPYTIDGMRRTDEPPFVLNKRFRPLFNDLAFLLILLLFCVDTMKLPKERRIVVEQNAVCNQVRFLHRA